MGDERAEELLPMEDLPAPSGRGRAVVIALVALVVALVAALASLTGGPEAPAPTGDPAATLDAALAQGEPVYVLIHSLT